MKDIFFTNLCWRNCETNPPKEFSNNNLIVTDGNIVEGMSWHRAEGYFIAENECCLKRLDNLRNWWWADITKNIREEFGED